MNKTQQDNPGFVLNNAPANVAQHPLTVKDLDGLDELERLANPDTLATAKKLTGEIEAHNADAAKFVSEVAAAQLGQIEGDAVKLANGLRQRRLSIAESRLRLVIARALLKEALTKDHLAYLADRRKELDKRRQDARAFATGVFGREFDGKLEGETVSRLIEDAQRSVEWRPRILNEIALADKPAISIAGARQQLAHAIMDAAGLADAYAPAPHVTVDPTDPEGRLHTWQRG